jgi:hypothetical protein
LKALILTHKTNELENIGFDFGLSQGINKHIILNGKNIITRSMGLKLVFPINQLE